MEELIVQFTNLVTEIPNETCRTYESLMTKLSQKCHGPAWEAALLRIVDTQMAHDYEAFFVLCTIYRRNKDFQKLGTLLSRCAYFSIHPSYNHLVVMYHVHSESFYDYEELLERAYMDARTFRDNAGYLHTFANSFATICENCNNDDRRVLIGRWYSKVMDAIDSALRLEPHYAKFYCTKGRIIAANEEYEMALAMIKEAISLEDSSRVDYPLAISNYQYYRLLIASKLQNRDLYKKIQDMEALLKDVAVPVSAPVQVPVPGVYNGDKNYAFVSYSHLDSTEVYHVIDHMNALSKRVWYDAGIGPGEEWSEVLGQRIEGCSAFILMLSNHSINSLNVRKEFNLALALSKPIVGVFLEDVVLTPGMRLQLELTQMIKKHELSQEDFLCKLQQLPE